MVGFVVRVKALYAEQKAYQEIQKIKEHYYDPFEKRPAVIAEVLCASITMNIETETGDGGMCGSSEAA